MKLFAYMCGVPRVRVKGRDLIKWVLAHSPSLAPGKTKRPKVRFPVSTISCFREDTHEDPRQVEVSWSWCGNTEEVSWFNRSVVLGVGEDGGELRQAPHWTVVEASCRLLSLGCKVLHFKIPNDYKPTCLLFLPKYFNYSGPCIYLLLPSVTNPNVSRNGHMSPWSGKVIPGREPLI